MPDWETGAERPHGFGTVARCPACGDRLTGRREYCEDCAEELETV